MVGRGSAWAPAVASCVCGQEEGPRGGRVGAERGAFYKGTEALKGEPNFGSGPSGFLSTSAQVDLEISKPYLTSAHDAD